MKKYLLASCAIVLAVAFSSFKVNDLVVVKFVGDASIQNEVNDPTKWHLTSISCEGGLAACAFQIENSDTYFNRVPSPDQLKSTMFIQSIGDVTDGFRPTQVKVSSGSATNLMTSPEYKELPE